MGHNCTCTCAHLFSYLGNGWTDSTGIWYVVRDPITKHFTKVQDGVQPYVPMCASADDPPFLYLGNGRMDRTEIWCGYGTTSYALYTGWEISALAHVHLSHILAHLFAPARSSPKRRLTDVKILWNLGVLKRVFGEPGNTGGDAPDILSLWYLLINALNLWLDAFKKKMCIIYYAPTCICT